MKKEITKEDVQDYISLNFDSFFVDALAKYVKDVIFPNKDNSEEEIKDYRDEIKQLIWEGISHGTKEYLEEYDGEAVKIISREFLKEIGNKEISIKFN